MINKRQGITYKEYLADLIDAGRKNVYPFPNAPKCEGLLDGERQEFAGYLLKRDMGQNCAGDTLLNLLESGNFELGDWIATYLVTDSPDNGDRLLSNVTQTVIDFYALKMQDLLDEAVRDKEAEPKDDPRDEYDPNEVVYD